MICITDSERSQITELQIYSHRAADCNICGNDICSKAGFLSSSTVPSTPLGSDRQSRPLPASLEEVKQCYHELVDMSIEAKQELIWWHQQAQSQNATPLVTKLPDLMIETDASSQGWGATQKDSGMRTGRQ